MTYSNRLDLDRFFFSVRNNIYVIVKLCAEFPNYYKGSDIDIFCYNNDEFAKLILNVGNRYLDRGFEIKVNNKTESHTYVDFYFEGELEFRFDLWQTLPEYKKIRLKPHYFFSVIENAVAVQSIFDGIEYTIYVPSEVDELLLRYVEYIEWYELRPDKIKHLDYIVNNISHDSNRISFIDKLHLYTELPEPVYYVKAPVRGIKKVRTSVGKVLGQIILKFPFLVGVYHKFRDISAKIFGRKGNLPNRKSYR